MLIIFKKIYNFANLYSFIYNILCISTEKHCKGVGLSVISTVMYLIRKFFSRNDPDSGFLSHPVNYLLLQLRTLLLPASRGQCLKISMQWFTSYLLPACNATIKSWWKYHNKMVQECYHNHHFS